MPRHTETKLLPYTAEQMFGLVADIDRYPEFLPWCTGARVLRRDGDVLTADLDIGYGPLHERFTSRVTLTHPTRIDVAYQRGPFRRLENHWTFAPAPGGCAVGFHIDFEFRSFLLRHLIGGVFGRAVDHMVASFEARAAHMFGPVAPAKLKPGRAKA